MLQARLSAADDVAVAREEAATRVRFEGEPPRDVSWRQAWRGIVAARTSWEARRWLQAAAEAATPIADARRARSERRAEVAKRLGFAHPWDAAFPPASAPALLASARRFLEGTDDLWRAVRREALRGTERADTADVLHSALARDAAKGGPDA